MYLETVVTVPYRLYSTGKSTNVSIITYGIFETNFIFLKNSSHQVKSSGRVSSRDLLTFRSKYRSSRREYKNHISFVVQNGL